MMQYEVGEIAVMQQDAGPFHMGDHVKIRCAHEEYYDVVSEYEPKLLATNVHCSKIETEK